MEVTPALKSYALEKVSVLNKYLDLNLRIHVTLAVDKFRKRAEVSVNGKGLHLQGMEETEDMYEAIDKVMDKIARQARKFKDKRVSHARARETEEMTAMPLEDVNPKIIKTDLPFKKPMSTSEAVDELNDNKLQFIVFRSSPGERINVLYHRSDGHLGLIET
jgi:putative sigma-54 modulation protein